MTTTENPDGRPFSDDRPAADPDRLGCVGELLLASDGTVTYMLERIVGEKIVTVYLDQSVAPVDEETAALMSFQKSGLITRTTNLAGATTGTVYVRAKTVFSPTAVPAVLHDDLLRTDEPIGRLLRRHRVECFREIISVDIPEYPLPLEPCRRYLVYIGKTPALLIEELFTRSCVQHFTAAS